MAFKTITPKKASKEIDELREKYGVQEGTILINCMNPCAKCEKIKAFISGSFRQYYGELGYNVKYSSTAPVQYWKLYGKANKVGQSTPQIYVIENDNNVAGVALVAGAKVGDYKIPAVSKWNTAMLKSVIKELMRQL